MSILFYLSLVIMFGYILLVIFKFGIPTSLSESYYLFGEKIGKPIFFAACGLAAFLLMVFWLDISEGTAQPLVFLGCASLIFTGAAGAFKESLTSKVHFVSAGICAILSQLWVIIYTPCWMLMIPIFAACIYIGLKTPGINEEKTDKNSLLFFVELASFVSTYLGVYWYYLHG